MASDRRFFVRTGGDEAERGPYNLGQLRTMWGNGTLTCDSLVREDGATRWEPVNRLIDEAKPDGAPNARTRPAIEPPTLAAQWVALVIVFVLSALLLGCYHIITGGPLSQPCFVIKESFGFKETFINIDEIAGMRWDYARARFPRSCSVLVWEHLILPNDHGTNLVEIIGK